MNIDEIALKVAQETGLRLDNACGCPDCRKRNDPPRIIKFTHALLAELANHGWKLVPIEPTEEMELRGAEVTDSIDWGDAQDDAPYELATRVYKAMLAAAPTPKEES